MATSAKRSGNLIEMGMLVVSMISISLKPRRKWLKTSGQVAAHAELLTIKDHINDLHIELLTQLFDQSCFDGVFNILYIVFMYVLDGMHYLVIVFFFLSFLLLILPATLVALFLLTTLLLSAVRWL